MTAGSRKPLQSVALYRRRVASETTPEPELSCDVSREAAKTSAEAFKKRGRPPKTASRVNRNVPSPTYTLDTGHSYPIANCVLATANPNAVG